MVGVRPGDVEPTARDVQAARRPARPLHAPLERDRLAATDKPELAERSRLQLAPSRQDSARPSPLRSDARAHAGRDAGVGERGALAELRPAAPPRFRCLRARRRQALPLGSLLADLERAEPPPLAEADEGRDLRGASAQPCVRGDPRRAAGRPGRRRRHGASRWVGGCRTRCLDSRHGRGPREARRLRTPPVPLVAGRDSVQRRLPQLPFDHDGDDSEAAHPRPALIRAEAGLAHRVRLPDQSAGHIPRRSAPEAGDAAQPCGDARVEAATGHDADPVPLPRRGRARPLPERARLRGQQVEALSAGIQVAVRGNAASTGSGQRSGARSAAGGPGRSRTGWRCSTRTSGRQSGATG